MENLIINAIKTNGRKTNTGYQMKKAYYNDKTNVLFFKQNDQLTYILELNSNSVYAKVSGGRIPCTMNKIISLLKNEVNI